jgi:hypothetical protein
MYVQKGCASQRAMDAFGVTNIRESTTILQKLEKGNGKDFTISCQWHILARVVRALRVRRDAL